MSEEKFEKAGSTAARAISQTARDAKKAEKKLGKLPDVKFPIDFRRSKNRKVARIWNKASQDLKAVDDTENESEDKMTFQAFLDRNTKRGALGTIIIKNKEYRLGGPKPRTLIRRFRINYRKSILPPPGYNIVKQR